MQREDDRDRAIDRALRQSIASMSVPSERSEASDHVDGETLAAWAEGNLRPDAAASIEQHLSDCAHCQHLLATFARTAPPPTVVEPLWRRWHLQWLVPIATAATVAAIWVAIPRQEQTRAIAPLADRKSTASAEPSVTPPPTPPAQREDAPAGTQPAPSGFAEPQLRKQAPQSLAKSAAISPTTKREEFERRDAQVAARPPAADAQAPSTPEAGQAGAREKDNGKPRALQEMIRPPAAAPVPAAPESAAGANASTAERRGAVAESRLLAARAFAATEIRSPNAAMRWRILDAGRLIERTTTGGAQWEPATLSSSAVLTTGASPSATVCWIVGRAGAVYLSTDGLRFVRVTFPESIDLVSVTATDDRHATVMSADGRSFRTDDGGMTWTR